MEVDISDFHARPNLRRQPPDQGFGLFAQMASRSGEKNQRKIAQGPSRPSDTTVGCESVQPKGSHPSATRGARLVIRRNRP